MKIYLISDNVDTRTGLRLVGIDGAVVHTHKELKEQLNKVITDKEIGLVLIVENLANKFPDIINDIKLNRKLPLVVEIPDRHGSGRKPDFITNYVKEAIGVRLE